jgi:competence protein ComEA
MMREIASIRNVIAVLGLMAAIAMASAASAAKTPPSSPVNINTASVEQLMEVPGIGQSKARAIVEYRAGSPFSTTAELLNVKGIGEKLLAKIMPYVTAGDGAQSRSGTAGRTGK